MKVLITGASGFLGRNLSVHLGERAGVEVLPLTRASSRSELQEGVRRADMVFHLAGVNRAEDESEFAAGNVELTRSLCEEVAAGGRKLAIVFTSSTQVDRETEYGRSKRAAEQLLLSWQAKTGYPLAIYRLPNVFGKWCRPDYNSVVATFCHNIARDLPIRVDDPDARLTLAYVDDVIENFLGVVDGGVEAGPFPIVAPTYSTTVGDLATVIRGFRAGRDSLVTDRVGTGLTRALYATYMSYLPPDRFSQSLPTHEDPRGRFAEVLRTLDSGQFSFFTAGPGVTRGEHYHQTKCEKFLVLRGRARFQFRNLDGGELHEVTTSADRPEIVDTVPGWAHSVTNLGDEELIVLLWASEVFDSSRPDTYPASV